jgi:hypothetical protein
LLKKSILIILVFLYSQSLSQSGLDLTFDNFLQFKDVTHHSTATQNKRNVSSVDTGTGPMSAVEKIFDGKLSFMGREQFPGSFQNYTCVYKSESAYILYHNCMASKKEAEATDIDIIDLNGGITHFYIENSSSGSISEMTRSEYDLTWTVDYRPSAPPGQRSVSGLISYMQQFSAINNKVGTCYIGGDFKAQDLTQKTKCLGPIKDSSLAREWASSAELFWREPGSRWHQALKYLRETVIESL